MLIPIASHAAVNQQPIFKQPVIVIDPGHGGADWGATDGLKEKDAALAIGKVIVKILESHGVKGILTRDRDYFISLDRRVEIARESKADLFVSIHANYYAKLFGGSFPRRASLTIDQKQWVSKPIVMNLVVAG